MSLLDNIRIVLVEPIFGGNIGSVCRAMNNNGITDLAIVNPNPAMDWDDARKLSCNATPQLDARKEYRSLEEAVADCTVVAGTSARTGFYRDTAFSPKEFAPIGLQSAQEHKIALVFGREDKGLFNEELALCTHIIQIPSSELYTSLNLSHAVYVCCYELFCAADIFQASEETAEEANSALRERMFTAWRTMMIETEFTHDQKLEHMMMGLRTSGRKRNMTEFPPKQHISKAEINELPMQSYEGRILLFNTEAEAESAAKKLLKETLLGFDTETRPAFRKGESYDPSLLQLATENEVYLFQIQQCGLTPSLIQVLSSPGIIKAGVAIERDIAELQAMEPFVADGFVELAVPAKKARIKNLGLRGLTAILFGFRISKKEQVSNWARAELTESQKTYAATDAWLGRKIYLAFAESGLV